ncbi:MAG: hypothetical protein QOI73_3022, partial [Solirubrobacteraceae bacterium]|nr:hypothetical protein [Solirubrobacteraceae bacterium]
NVVRKAHATGELIDLSRTEPLVTP